MTTREQTKICGQCGTKSPQDADFCPQCGAAVASENNTSSSNEMLQTIGSLNTINPAAVNSSDAAEQETLRPGTQFANRYEIIEKIGAGGMGLVYKALDQVTNKTIALKLIHPRHAASDADLERLREEGITARDIRHKHVVAVYDVGQNGNQPYITMEYLPGRSLRDWISHWQHGGMNIPVADITKAIAQILSGLNAAHEAGVVHRDLKPENIMLVDETQENFAVKILDFGIARALSKPPQVKDFSGTMGYMAPEQSSNPHLVGPPADIYAVSVMFYELLVGMRPQGHWQPPSGCRRDVPHGIDQLIEHGLNILPQNRIPSANVYLDQLRRHAGNLLQQPRPNNNRTPQTAVQSRTGNHSEDSKSQSSISLLLVGLLVAVVLGLGGIFSVCVFSGLLVDQSQLTAPADANEMAGTWRSRYVTMILSTDNTYRVSGSDGRFESGYWSVEQSVLYLNAANGNQSSHEISGGTIKLNYAGYLVSLEKSD